MDALRLALERVVFEGPGHTETSLRRFAARARTLPFDLHVLVKKVHQTPWKVTDEEIAALRSQYTDDELFEVVVAASLGAAGERLDEALSILEEVPDGQ